MRIGVPKEIKDKENRVALTPAGASRLLQAGHSVRVEASAGLGSGFSDGEYLKAGAEIVPVEAAWDTDLVIKVKEPLEAEYRYLKGQMLFTYLHLSGAPRTLTEVLLEQKATALAYETLEDREGRLPLLAPMSAVAGTMAVTIGSYYLAQSNRGKGVLLGKILGESHGKVVILGDGVVGRHAAQTAAGQGANVFIGGPHAKHAAQIKRETSEAVNFFLSTPDNIAREVEEADLVIGAVLLRGARAPYVVTEAMVKRMQKGSVIVDVSIDQGGCIETSHPTSHSDPVYEKHGVIHYCVTNMPGAYPRTSTLALTQATLPYILKLADQGLSAVRADPGSAHAVNTYRGYITYRPVAEALGLMSRFKELSSVE